MDADTDSKSPKQCFVAVQFGGHDTEPVMMPVRDLSVLEDEEEKRKILDSAWAFVQRGEFARASINPSFIEGLATDLSKGLEIHEILSPLVVAGITELYLKRLKEELEQRGEAVIDSNALHLKIERRVENNLDIIFDPPDRWEEIASDRISELTHGCFPTPATVPCPGTNSQNGYG
jgi:hypothetical protein